MLNRNNGPRGGLYVWLMAVIVICLTPAIHPTSGGIVVMAIDTWATPESQQRYPARTCVHVRTGRAH